MRDLEICYNIFIGKNTSAIIEVQSSIVIEYSDRVIEYPPLFSKTGPQQFDTFLTFWGNLASCEFSHFWECEIVKFRSKSGKNVHKCTDSKPLLKTKPQQFDLSKVFSNNAKFHKPKCKASVEIMVLCLIYTWSHYFQIWHIKDNLVDLDILNISL